MNPEPMVCIGKNAWFMHFNRLKCMITCLAALNHTYMQQTLGTNLRYHCLSSVGSSNSQWGHVTLSEESYPKSIY